MGDSLVKLAYAAHKLGSVFDSKMSLADYVNGIGKLSYANIRNISKIRSHNPTSVSISLANELSPVALIAVLRLLLVSQSETC